MAGRQGQGDEPEQDGQVVDAGSGHVVWQWTVIRKDGLARIQQWMDWRSTGSAGPTDVLFSFMVATFRDISLREHSRAHLSACI